MYGVSGRSRKSLHQVMMPHIVSGGAVQPPEEVDQKGRAALRDLLLGMVWERGMTGSMKTLAEHILRGLQDLFARGQLPPYLV